MERDVLSVLAASRVLRERLFRCLCTLSEGRRTYLLPASDPEPIMPSSPGEERRA